MGYVHTSISSPFITIQKDEGIQPATMSLHFHLHALIVSLTQSQRLFTMLQYNTIPYTAVLQCFSFIGEIQWENTTVNLIPWVRKNIGQQISPKKISGAPSLNHHFSGGFPQTPISRGRFPRTPFFRALPRTLRQGERVYNTPGVQTRLNNISGSRRLGSIANI